MGVSGVAKENQSSVVQNIANVKQICNEFLNIFVLMPEYALGHTHLTANESAHEITSKDRITKQLVSTFRLNYSFSQVLKLHPRLGQTEAMDRSQFVVFVDVMPPHTQL